MATPADIPSRAAAALDVDAAAVVDADDLRDAFGASDGAVRSGDLPWEADPADVAEQDVVVPYDDDER